ncbi:MAG: flagellar basal body P-ring formation protein FlgA [candidate division Zixibacteria bacterium]|nr:flagellar basal body P-ring formation protein FlgA [candidate division Zixibacteria bacterium]
MYKQILVISVIGLLLGGYVFGTDSTAEISLDDYITAQITSDYQLDPKYTEITIVRLDIKQKDISGCDVKIIPLTEKRPRGRFPIRIELFQNDEMIARGSASINVRVFKDLLVPVRRIKRHELLFDDMFELKRFDVTSLSERMLANYDELSACRSRQNLSPDRYIPTTRIEKIPEVDNGTQVSIIGKSDIFEIKVRGIALQQGYVGELIKVKNIDSKKILTGRIIAPGVVEVSI